MRTMFEKIILISLSILSVLLLSDCSQSRMIKEDETFRAKNTSTLITTGEQAHEFETVDVRLDSVFGFSGGKQQTVFSRSEVLVINETQHNYIRYPLLGAVVGGTWAYFATPDEEDVYVIPEYWAVVYGALGAGAGYYVAYATTSIRILYFDEDLFTGYTKRKEKDLENQRVEEIQKRLSRSDN